MYARPQFLCQLSKVAPITFPRAQQSYKSYLITKYLNIPISSYFPLFSSIIPSKNRINILRTIFSNLFPQQIIIDYEHQGKITEITQILRFHAKRDWSE